MEIQQVKLDFSLNQNLVICFSVFTFFWQWFLFRHFQFFYSNFCPINFQTEHNYTWSLHMNYSFPQVSQFWWGALTSNEEVPLVPWLIFQLREVRKSELWTGREQFQEVLFFEVRGVRAYEWPEVELTELVCFLYFVKGHISDVMMMKRDQEGPLYIANSKKNWMGMGVIILAHSLLSILWSFNMCVYNI